MLRRIAAVAFVVLMVATLWLTFRPAPAQPEAADVCVRPQVVVKLPRVCLPLV